MLLSESVTLLTHFGINLIHYETAFEAAWHNVIIVNLQWITKKWMVVSHKKAAVYCPDSMTFVTQRSRSSKARVCTWVLKDCYLTYRNALAAQGWRCQGKWDWNPFYIHLLFLQGHIHVLIPHIYNSDTKRALCFMWLQCSRHNVCWLSACRSEEHTSELQSR